jgi:hypothetical protein
LESQRISGLIEGYLRGWLTFDYPQRTSRIREEVILHKLQNDRMFELLKEKLFIETTLRATTEKRSKEIIEPIFDLNRMLIALKLPSIVAKDKIKQEKKDLDKAELAEWKALLTKINNK